MTKRSQILPAMDDEPEDVVFKALADRTRRHMLDRQIYGAPPRGFDPPKSHLEESHERDEP